VYLSMEIRGMAYPARANAFSAYGLGCVAPMRILSK